MSLHINRHGRVSGMHHHGETRGHRMLRHAIMGHHYRPSRPVVVYTPPPFYVHPTPVYSHPRHYVPVDVAYHTERPERYDTNATMLTLGIIALIVGVAMLSFGGIEVQDPTLAVFGGALMIGGIVSISCSFKRRAFLPEPTPPPAPPTAPAVTPSPAPVFTAPLPPAYATPASSS